MKPFRPFDLDGSWNIWALLSVFGTVFGGIILYISILRHDGLLAIPGFFIFAFALMGLFAWIIGTLFEKLGWD